MYGLYDPEAALRDFPGGPVVKTSPSNTGAVGSIPGWGAKISHASQGKKTNNKYCNKFSKDFKNSPCQKKKKRELKKKPPNPKNKLSVIFNGDR